jgi:hypothetical protein
MIHHFRFMICNPVLEFLQIGLIPRSPASTTRPTVLAMYRTISILHHEYVFWQLSKQSGGTYLWMILDDEQHVIEELCLHEVMHPTRHPVGINCK